MQFSVQVTSIKIVKFRHSRKGLNCEEFVLCFEFKQG